MKTIQELHAEMVEAVAVQSTAAKLTFKDQILQAQDSRVSKRVLLGLERKHKRTDTPLFTDAKTLF